MWYDWLLRLNRTKLNVFLELAYKLAFSFYVPLFKTSFFKIQDYFSTL